MMMFFTVFLNGSFYLIFFFAGHRRASSYGSSVMGATAAPPSGAPLQQLMRGHSQTDIYGHPAAALYPSPYFCKYSLLKSASC